MAPEIRVIELPQTGDFKLPGISTLHLNGFTSLAGKLLSLSLKASSFRTAFNGNPPGQEGLTLPLDTWTTVSERSRRVEFKALAPLSSVRFILYRELPPDPAAPPPATDPARLIVLARDTNGPIADLQVELVPVIGAQPQILKTDRTGKADFSVAPEPEYTIRIVGTTHVPFLKHSCIGGETYTAELQPLPPDAKVLTLANTAQFRLPGVSPIGIFGWVGPAENISAVYLKPSSPKTKLAGFDPAQERAQVEVDAWTPVSEGLKRYEIKVLAPDAQTRLVLYRKPH